MNRPIQLLRVRERQVVDAIVTEVTQKHLNDAETLWEPLLQGTGEEDEYWNWVAKSRRATLLPGDELYAIECDGVTQGLMTIDILKKRCQIESQLRRRLVYIRALATAPWNRPAITNPPTYIGGNLIDFAICASQQRFAIAKVREQNPEETGELQVVKVGGLLAPDPVISLELTALQNRTEV